MKKEEAIEILKKYGFDYKQFTDEDLYDIKHAYLNSKSDLQKANEENKKVLLRRAVISGGFIVLPGVAFSLASLNPIPALVFLGLQGAILGFSQHLHKKSTKNLREETKAFKEIYDASIALGLELPLEKEKEIAKNIFESCFQDVVVYKKNAYDQVIGEEMYRLYGNGEVEDLNPFSEFMTEDERAIDLEGLKVKHKTEMKKLLTQRLESIR